MTERRPLLESLPKPEPDGTEAKLSGAAYQVGRFTLIPFRELMDGRDQVPIGRKPLEILSVLARSAGALVTKDELMAAVWPNVIVEDNAVQAHIAALRKILGEDAQLLTTARGRGYRLAATPAAADGATFESAPSRSRKAQRWFVPALAGVLVLGVSVAGWRAYRGLGAALPTPRPSIAMGAFTSAHGDPGEQALAASMNTEVAEALSRYDVTVIAPRPDPGGPAHAPGADFAVRGRVARTAQGFTVTTDLADNRANILVYSFDTDQPSGAKADVSQAVAAHVALSMDPSKLTNDLDGKLTPTDYTIIARFNDAVDRQDTGDMLDQSQNLAQRHPLDGDLQGALGLTAFFAARGAPSREDKVRDLELARRSIRRADELSPNSALTCIAKQVLKNGPLSYAAQEQLERRAIQLNPRQHVAYNGLGETLLAVGRTREGISFIKRSVQLDPMSGVVVYGNLADLIRAGDAEDASQLLAREELIWPGALRNRIGEMSLAYYLGDPDQVAALARKFGPPPPGVDPARVDLLLQAWRTRAPASIRRMVASCFKNYGASVSQVEDQNCLFVMVRVGDLDDAFRFAALVYPDNRNLYPIDADEWITRAPPGLDPTWLFAPVMAPLRDDPRFWDIAVRTGMTNYWLTTGAWPDFCSQQLDRCKQSASAGERAHPARPLRPST